MELSKLFFDLIDVKRDIYQNAELFPQNRKPPNDYEQKFLKKSDYLDLESVADFIKDKDTNATDWEKQNTKFLNYHKSLNPHTFFNSIPIDHYIGSKTGLAKIKDQVVFDVGGGTGHFLSSFFRYPHSLQYFLIDPNVRLLHDQFIRMYPELLEIPIGHIRSYAEDLPFKNEVSDLVISSSAIDHYKDYRQFIHESYRVLKPQGKLLISSHLKGAKSSARNSKFSIRSTIEKGVRILHRLKNGVAVDDHVEEFESTDPIINELISEGFTIEQNEKFKQYFYILARK